MAPAVGKTSNRRAPGICAGKAVAHRWCGRHYARRSNDKETLPLTTAPTTRNGSSHLGRATVARVALFAGLWLVIAGNDPDSWVIGVPTVLLATWASLCLRGNIDGFGSISLSGLVRFVPYFLIESFRGGFDVARRVLRPRLRVHPGFQSYRPQLASPAARVVFLDAISLLPGTLSADMRDGAIDVHALDNRTDLTPELARLERTVGRLFGERLDQQSV